MTFSEILKNAANNTFTNRREGFDSVMSVFKSANACPPGSSPKQLLEDLKNSINNAKKKKIATKAFINEIYNIAISSDVAVPPPDGNVDSFIQNIHDGLAATPDYQSKFDEVAKDDHVRDALDGIYKRIVHRYVVTNTPQGANTYSGLSADGSVHINLSCRTQQTTGDSVEDAIRSVFFDVRKARKDHGRSDLVVNSKTIVEIKYARDKFTGLATDSQALKIDPTKWYLYVTGDLPKPGQAGTMKAWFINSEDLYNEIAAARNANPSINPSNPGALTEIEDEIEAIKGQLAKAIYNKSITSPDEATPAQMTLTKSIGVNRVRFDIKFEGLIRAYVREMLRS